MRRLFAFPAVVAIFTISACTSSTATQRTVTMTNTITSGAASALASGARGAISGTSVSVVVPSSSAAPSSVRPSVAPSSASPKTTPKPTPTTASVAAIVKVDPLKADCTTLLTAEDVKDAIGATIPTSSLRVRDVADPTRGVTGKIRCRYGSTDNGKTAKIGVILTQYETAAAAKKQVTASVQTEIDLGATSSIVGIKGTPATILLRSGGLILLQYDTWTMSISAADKLAANAKLVSGLPALAQEGLARLTKKN